MRSNILINTLLKILILLTLSFNYAQGDNNGSDILVKLIVESKYEFHNRFGEYIEIMQYQIKTNFDKLGKVSSIVHYDGEGNLQRKDIYYYNNDGFLVELSSYSPDGLLVWKNIFAYDDHNKITREASYDPDGSLAWEDKYKYDKNDHLLEKVSYLVEEENEYISRTFRYNSQNQLAKETSYYPDGKRSSDFIYTYAFDGKLVEEKFYDYYKKLTLKDQYKYDRKDNIKEWIVIDKDEKLVNNYEGIAKKTYQYNRKNNIIGIELKNEQGSVVNKEIFQYGKDERLLESVKF
ncbi:uncharacterized protein METZ01_LOCUS181970, partial [marine metagenome]